MRCRAFAEGMTNRVIFELFYILNISKQNSFGHRVIGVWSSCLPAGRYLKFEIWHLEFALIILFLGLFESL